MKPERWAKIEEIFQSALDRPAAVRAAFIKEKCGDDVELRAEIENLVNRYDTENPFLESPVWSDSHLFKTTLVNEIASSLEREIADVEAKNSLTGRTVGAYRLTEELGRGGMGVVYLAERTDDFRQCVAVKIVKRGMETDVVLRRFRQERQVLATLDHPNIARLLDGGATADGRPFLVMEYVEGVPIDVYCDENKLPIRERLKLFQKVCAAVGYSHQRLVIHRDIKPSNILVTAGGEPKLLDFGIAKLLDASLASSAQQLTATGSRIMTPDYASPEQLRGENITTVSDVYSLGVLLYYLLTGHLPFASAASQIDAFARIVSERKPERPSAVIVRKGKTTAKNTEVETTERSSSEVAVNRATEPERLRRYLADDLDNIVLKALRKETDRRYSSVEQLSEDIRRHLEGLPVRARGDDFVYKTRKLVRRHKRSVVAAALLSLTLVGGIAATSRQAEIADRERVRAEAESERARRRFNESRRLTESLMFEVSEAIRDLQGATQARELLAKRTLEHLDGLAREADDDADLQSELAIAYINLGNVQGNPYYPNLGDVGAALESYLKAEKLTESLSAADPSNARLQRRYWLTQIRIGDVLTAKGDLSNAAQKYFRAVSIIENTAANNPADESLRGDLASSYDRQGNFLLKSGDTRSALEVYSKAQKIFERASAVNPENDNLLRSVASGHGKIGLTYLKSGEIGRAIESYQKLLQINESRLAKNPANAVTLDDVAGSLRVFGDAQMTAKDYSGAFKSYNRQLDIYRRLAAADSVNVRTSVELAVSHGRLGSLQTLTGNTAGGLENHEKAHSILRDLASKNPKNVFVANQLPFVFYRLGDANFTLASGASNAVKKAGFYRAAREFFEQSKQAYSESPQHIDSFPENAEQLSDIESRIAACDAALARH